MRVVQRRLFADLGPEEGRVAVARGYADVPGRYRRQLADTGEERRDADAEAERFADRILASCPFHPELLDLMLNGVRLALVVMPVMVSVITASATLVGLALYGRRFAELTRAALARR
jgi:hypothetical protein